MATTIDHISQGRFDSNMVCRWFTPEMEKFGAKIMKHDTRYEYATEWAEVMDKLSTGQYFDYKGAFFTIDEGFADAGPYRSPCPLLISAGSSPHGRKFAAKTRDINGSVVEDLEKGKARLKTMKKLA